MISKKTGKNINVHLIISHPKGNETFLDRIKSFKNILESKNYAVKIPHIHYPFEQHYQGVTEIIQVWSSDSLTDINPKINFIQRAAIGLHQLSSSKLYTKVLSAFHIILFKIDLWYIPLYKSYKIQSDENNLIIASGGPGSVFKMGCELAQKTNSKLILDYRDPWNLGYDLLKTSPLINKIKQKIMLADELKILKKAHHITTVSESLKRFFPKEYHHKITVVENGSNFEQKDILHQINPKPEKFSINYLGTIYNEQLFGEVFFKAFADFYISTGNSSLISLNFIGADKNNSLKKLIKKYDLQNITTITKRINTDELLPYLTHASLFLQLRFKGRSQIITSKITDYLMFRKPILLPVSDEGDIAETIEKYQAGYVCNGVEDTKVALQKEYQKFLDKENIMIHQEDLSHLSRSEIAKKLIKVMEDIGVYH